MVHVAEALSAMEEKIERILIQQQELMDIIDGQPTPAQQRQLEGLNRLLDRYVEVEAHYRLMNLVSGLQGHLIPVAARAMGFRPNCHPATTP